MPIRILVADDHGILRAGLCALLDAVPDLEVVGEAADGHEVLRRVEELRPDVVLLDIGMPGLDGIEVTRRLEKAALGVRILILTIHTDGEILQEAIRAGASGYIVKMAASSDLVNAVHTVAQGDTYIHPMMSPSLENAPASARSPNGVGELLTPREMEVLRLIGRGYTNHQIAEELNISERTVRGHRTSLGDKLGLHSRAELARYALEHNLPER
jgi:two-component system response regulator NreC